MLVIITIMNMYLADDKLGTFGGIHVPQAGLVQEA